MDPLLQPCCSWCPHQNLSAKIMWILIVCCVLHANTFLAGCCMWIRWCELLILLMHVKYQRSSIVCLYTWLFDYFNVCMLRLFVYFFVFTKWYHVEYIVVLLCCCDACGLVGLKDPLVPRMPELWFCSM